MKTLITEIVKALVKKGFMSGPLGDTSDEFIQERIEDIMSLYCAELKQWLVSNKFNICHYCRLQETFNQAMSL